MKKLLRALKQWTLLIAITVGAVGHSFFSQFTWLAPWLLASMLLLTFCNISPRDLRFHPLHLILMGLQVAMSLGLYALTLPWHPAIAQGVCMAALTPTATVTLRNAADQVVTACEYGTGPIDAMCKAVNKIVQVDNDLTEFAVQSVTRGIDALGEVTIRVTDPTGAVYTGRGADGDIVVSSTKAYLNALNRLLDDKQERRK